MSTNFKDIERQLIKHELMRRQGQVPLGDAIYQSRERSGLYATGAEPPKLSVWSGEIRRELQAGLAVLFGRLAHANSALGAGAPAAVGAIQSLGSIPALFVSTDGSSSTPVDVEVLQMPVLRPDGKLVIGIRIPNASCPGETADVAVFIAPDDKPVAQLLSIKVGMPEVLSVEVPAEQRSSLQNVLRDAVDDVTRLDWAKLPLRFVVRSTAPPKERMRAASDEEAESLLPFVFRGIMAIAAQRFGLFLRGSIPPATVAEAVRRIPGRVVALRRPSAVPLRDHLLRAPRLP